MPTPVRGGRPPPHLRHHQPPRRGQDHAHREVPALRRRAAVGRRGEGARRAAPGHVGLDGDGAEARHLDHLDGAAVPLPRLACSTCSTPRATATSPRTPTGCWPRPTPRSWCSTRPRASSRRPSSCSRSAASATCRCSRSSTSGTGPGRDPLELLDEIEAQLVDRARRRSPGRSGIAGDFRGVVDRRTRRLHPLHPHRPGRHRGRRGGPARSTRPRPRRATPGRRRAEELGAARRGRRPRRPRAVPQGRGHPGVLRLGAHQLRRAAAARRGRRPRAVAGAARRRRRACPRPLDAPFSAFVFKVQANMDPSHRDRIAFVRVCSGRFERGMVVTHGPTGKPFATKYAHSVFGQERETIEEAWPGDVVGLVNATDVTVGDALYARRAGRVPAASRVRARALRRRPREGHRPVQAVPPRHRPARRGGRGAGAPRPRPRRPGARCSPRSARCSSRWPPTGSSTSSARRSSWRPPS